MVIIFRDIVAIPCIPGFTIAPAPVKHLSQRPTTATTTTTLSQSSMQACMRVYLVYHNVEGNLCRCCVLCAVRRKLKHKGVICTITCVVRTAVENRNQEYQYTNSMRVLPTYTFTYRLDTTRGPALSISCCFEGEEGRQLHGSSPTCSKRVVPIEQNTACLDYVRTAVLSIYAPLYSSRAAVVQRLVVWF